MRRTVLLYGLLSGVVGFVLLLITQSLSTSPDGKLDFSKGELFGYINMILALSLVFFGARQYRDKNLGGNINFGKAFQVGILIALVAGLMYVAGWMIYYYTEPSAKQHLLQYTDYMKEKWVAAGMSAEELAKKTAELEKNMAMIKNPFILALFTFFEILPVGAIVSLISAFILKNGGKKVVSSE